MITVELLDEYSLEDATKIGKLLPVLSPKFSGEPVTEALLREVIDSAHHEQFVARMDGAIVGIATLSITIGIGAGRKVYLEDFAVSPAIQGQGIGDAIWKEITNWCRERHLKLHFTSNAKREAAHHFYLKHGATVYDTAVFNWTPENV